MATTRGGSVLVGTGYIWIRLVILLAISVKEFFELVEFNEV